MVTAQEKLSWILLYAVIVGFFLGLVYDIVRLRRLLSGKNKNIDATRGLGKRIECILVFVEDILFAFICSVVLCIFIYYTNSGRFRGVIPLGSVVGFAIYRKTLGRLIRPLLVRVVCGLVWIVKKIFYIVFLPLARLSALFYRATAGRVYCFIRTAVYKRAALAYAESGFGIIKNKGKKYNEKEFKHILKSRGGSYNTVLYGDNNKNAI